MLEEYLLKETETMMCWDTSQWLEITVKKLLILVTSIGLSVLMLLLVWNSLVGEKVIKEEFLEHGKDQLEVEVLLLLHQRKALKQQRN